MSPFPTVNSNPCDHVTYDVPKLSNNILYNLVTSLFNSDESDQTKFKQFKIQNGVHTEEDW